MVDLALFLFFFFQAEDGIRDTDRSRGLGDVYKRQDYRGIWLVSWFLREFCAKDLAQAKELGCHP